jgi:hypothetical protein
VGEVERGEGGEEEGEEEDRKEGKGVGRNGDKGGEGGKGGNRKLGGAHMKVSTWKGRCSGDFGMWDYMG